MVKGGYREQWMQQCWLSAVQITLRILYHVELIQGRICMQGDVQQLSCAAIILILGDKDGVSSEIKVCDALTWLWHNIMCKQ